MMASNPPDIKAEKDDEFTTLMKRASSVRAAGNLAQSITLFEQALKICPRTMMATCHVQEELMTMQKAERRGVNPWGKEAEKGGKIPIPRVIPLYLQTRCKYWALAGGIGGFGVGWWGGSPLDGLAWAVLMAVATYFLAISLADTHSPAITRSNLILVGIQIGLFAILGSVLGATTGDSLGPSSTLKLGLALIFFGRNS